MNQIIKPAPSIVSHQQARNIVVALKQRQATPNEVSTLARYVVEREATSIDLQNTVKGVLEIGGPTILGEVKRYVESNRPRPRQ
jgi:RecB family endonuclease NucS